PDKDVNSTKEISRSHKLIVEKSKLITITGGKWTTYRKMAEDTVNKAIKIGNLRAAPCITSTLQIHGSVEQPSGPLAFYGSDEKLIQQFAASHPLHNKILGHDSPYSEVNVIWAVRHEMARTIED